MEDVTIVISDQLENNNFDVESFSDFMTMATDYQNKLILEQLAEEFNQ